MTTRSIVISFFVSVPVLSEQITDAEPSVSTDDSFFTIACRRAMRCTPSASTTDRIAGRPSGTAATASETPSSSTSTTSRRRRDVGGEQDRADDHDGDRRSTAMPEHAPDAVDLALQRRALLLGARRAGAATLPISVAMPVAVTTARPRPRVTAVPLKTMFTPVAEPDRLGERGDVLQHRLALAGQRRLGDRQRRRLDQPRVGADRVALGQQQDVAGHHVGGGNRAPRARRARRPPSPPPSAAAPRPPARRAPPARSRARR